MRKERSSSFRYGIVYARFIIDRIDFTLASLVTGQLLLMIFVGFVTWLGLAILGLEASFSPWCSRGAIFSFVPNFGPIAALVPSLVVGLVQSPQHIAWIILIIYGTSFLQSQLIAPLLFEESLNLPPVMVLIGQIFATAFFGFSGHYAGRSHDCHTAGLGTGSLY